MVRVRSGIHSAIIFLLLAAQRTHGAVPAAEDLSGCKLPNGMIKLPIEGQAPRNSGELFRVATHSFISYPSTSDGKALTPDQAMAIVRAAHSADIMYLPDQGGAFWAFSGRIAELGVGYLSDHSGKKLDAPLDLPKTSTSRAGLNPIAEDRVYLLQTTENKFALLRVLEKTKSATVIQFVYQPDGGLTFDIPHNLPVAYGHSAEPEPAASATTPSASPTAATSTAAALAGVQGDLSGAPHPTGLLPPAPRTLEGGPDDYIAPGIIIIGGASGRGGATSQPNTLTSPGVDPAIDAFTRQRAQLIEGRLSIVRAPAKTNAEIETKAKAISDLSLLHADEAADVLVAQITFFNPRTSAREFSPDAFHPAAAALKRLGKPATGAAISALRQLDVNSGDGMDSDLYKIGLLGEVIRFVEGDAIAAYLYRQEIEHAPDAKHKAVFEYLLTRLPGS